MQISSESLSAQGASPRFLCDVMLARLARYLRAAGYDTAQAADGLADRDILLQAIAEGRWLLTLDRKIIEHKAARGRVVTLCHGSLDDQVGMLSRYFAMDWTGRAFTRCLLDNALLRPATEGQLAAVPADVLRPGEALSACPRCGRVYWPGSHYRRMMGHLRRWQESSG